MLRVEYRDRGPVPQDVLELVEFELPAPGPGEVLVKVLAATINPSDLLLITGKYGQLPPLPARCGNEGVGQVESLGAGACPLQVGQLVLLPVDAAAGPATCCSRPMTCWCCRRPICCNWQCSR